MLIGSVLSITSLLSLPKRTKRTVLAQRKVLPLFVRAAHVPVTHRHRLNAVLLEEVLHFLLDLRIRRNSGGDPPFDDRLGFAVQNDARRNLRGSLVVRAVEGHGADRIFRWLAMLGLVLV